ncbi:MAG TPA: hypothetical protein VGV63_11980 [Acidimicrobiales bacterium]|nr:hypothetical protein [Acidimicrobiales bacterium]
MPSTPMARVAGAHTRRAKFDRRMGSPSGVGNTSPLRTTSGRASRPSSIDASAAGTDTFRRPALVLGSPQAKWPESSLSCSTTAMLRRNRLTRSTRRPASSPQRIPV